MRNTLKKHQDFIFGDARPAVRTDLFIAKDRPTLFPADARYGLIVTKKTFKLAVKRNRAKRCLRVWIRDNEHLMRPDRDYIFIARRNILDASRTAGAHAMAAALSGLTARK
jgi:ribonuclease P protein component